MTPAVTAILTNGLTCGVTSACEGGTLLTAGPFQLFCSYVPTVKVYGGGGSGGGSGSTGASNISSSLIGGYAAPQYSQPTLNYPNSDETVMVPFDARMIASKAPITVRMKFGDKELEKVYLLDINKVKGVIKVVNLVNLSKAKLSLSVSKIKRITNNIHLKVKNSRYYPKNKNY